ncbi:MAG: zinc ribbon domain-containing protein [Chloroflexota bacterium]
MDISSLVAITILVFVTLWWVLRPLWLKETPDKTDITTPAGQDLAELIHQRDARYVAIKDLEQDFLSGKVSDVDYHQLRLRLTQDAAQILKQIDTITTQTESDIDGEIDALVSQYQQEDQSSEADKALLKLAQDEIKATLSHDAEKHCPNCLNSIQPKDAFCSQCGTPVNKQCPQCAQAVLPTDRFCAQCGTSLVGEVIS